MDSKLAPPLRPPELFGDGSMVWRRWRVVPDAQGIPLLTGLLGFPWRDRILEARCVALDPSIRGGRYSGRYHRAVPAADCTCGIYAVRGDLDSTILPRARPSEPIVEGFVRLSGRSIENAAGVRAERAEIVGPLLVRTGDGSFVDRWLARTAASIVAAGDRYRVVRRRRAEADLQDLIRPVADGLARRYRCEVLAGRS